MVDLDFPARSLVSALSRPARTWNFFRTGTSFFFFHYFTRAERFPLLVGKGVLTKANFPNDLDTTSLGLTILPPSTDVIHSVLDEMLEYVNNDGIVQVSSSTTPYQKSCLNHLVLNILPHRRPISTQRALASTPVSA